MPIPSLHRRSYGYTKHTTKRQTKRYGNTKRRQRWFKQILVFPFLVLIWILRLFWQVLLISVWRKTFLHFCVIIIVLSLIIGTIVIAWISRDLPDPDRLTDSHIEQSTKIYDRSGEHLLYEIFANEKRTLVDLEDIPQSLVNGVIATEDKEFFKHPGIRPLSIIRAFVYGLFSTQQIGGTSTLTQQLVKNAILTNERTITRKIKEAVLSIRLEQKYSKQQILKIYFNEIPYGSTNYGVEAAAQSYFGKRVNDLTLDEAATLAGLPKAPTKYLNNQELLLERRNFVLKRMFEEGYITDIQKKMAQTQPLNIKQRYDNIEAPHFVLYIKEQLDQEFGERVVNTGGLRVLTSLDWEKQQLAQTVIDEEGKVALTEAGANNTALVSLDPRTGQILAMVGSKDFFDQSIDGQFNVAALGRRQPGSSFKPIIYAAAFEKGYTPDTVLFDVITNFAVSGKPYIPHNYNNKEYGPVTIRQALQGSLNIPAVQTLYLVGIENALSFSNRLGYTTFENGNFGLSLVLGGGEVTLLEHTAAFGVFANQGLKQKPVSILKIEDAKGEIIKEWKQKNGERVLSTEITDTISNILSDNAARSFIFGAGNFLTLPDRQIAVKTGTTNDYIDAWTVGYTPSLVTGVWVGNTDNSKMKPGADGSKIAAPIWNRFMREALKNIPPEIFPEPPKNETRKAVLHGASGGLITLKINTVTGNIASSSTPPKNIAKQTFLQPHSILHYVDKDNPQGEIPENPNLDPQYDIWEAAIQNWIQRQKEANPKWNLVFTDPPYTYDTPSSLELAPALNILFPLPNTTFVTREINSIIEVSAPRGVHKVIYRIDGQLIATLTSPPFNLSFSADRLSPGVHVLSVIALDDKANQTKQDIPITLQVEPLSPFVSWVGESLNLTPNDFPHTFFLNHFDLSNIQSVTIYQQKEGQAKSWLLSISDFSNLFNNQLSIVWKEKPDKGQWTLVAEITLLSGETKVSDLLSVNIQ